MARMKRPAEKAISNRGKRPRTSKKNDVQSPQSDCQDVADASDHEPVLEEEETTDSLSKALMNIDKTADGMKRRRQQFEKEVNGEDARLSGKIKKARTQINENRKAFLQSMLPVLASAIQNIDLDNDSASEFQRPMVFEAPNETPVALKASEVLIRSKILLESYDTLKNTRPGVPSTIQMVNTFAKDKEETVRAFQAAKKITTNQLKMKLTNKLGETPELFEITDDEHHLARGIMARGKVQGQISRKVSDTSIGPLLYDFGKVVGKMQSLVR